MVHKTKKLIIPNLIEKWFCCSTEYKVYSKLAEHIENEHLYIEEGISESSCNNCFKINNSLYESVAHFLFDHVQRKFKCVECRTVFNQFESFIEHEPHCELAITLDKRVAERPKVIKVPSKVFPEIEHLSEVRKEKPKSTDNLSSFLCKEKINYEKLEAAIEAKSKGKVNKR